MKQQIMKKKRGDFTAYMFMFLVVFAFMVFSMCLYKRNIALVTVRETEDNLKAATLAGAVINLNEYGATGDIIISDYNKSYENFKESLISSMDLDNNFTPINTSVISSPIHINQYTIYNVRGNTVECISYTDGGLIPSITTGVLGGVVTPNNVIVEKSTVYSSITFQITGFVKEKSMMGKVFQMDDITVTKSSCVDISKD